MKAKVCILDYGSGNVGSVYNLLKSITPDVQISNSPDEITASSHLILPGVGAFGAAMDKIRTQIPLSVLKDQVLKLRKPFLGICVGMQVLAAKGYEFGEFDGLGWIPGNVTKLEAGELPLPHIGWNDVSFNQSSPLNKSFQTNQDFYFLHSYSFKPVDINHSIATCTYGETFCAAVAKENILGVQFHPEKSQKAGVLLLKNFLAMSSV